MLDPVEFTSVMRRAATPVSIVTTCGEHGVHGATVSAVCSLSAQPASVLICLNQSSRLLGMIHDHGVFCVNYLAEGHDKLALAFAGAAEHASQRGFFPDVWDRDSSTQLPVLKNAAAIFTCRHVQTVSFGTHDILIGQVERAQAADVTPLAYWDGAFRNLVAQTTQQVCDPVS